MPASTPVQGWTIPGGGDAPVNAAAFATLAAAIEVQSVMVFASAAARDTAIPTGSRKAGMIAFITALGVHQRVVTNGGSWVPLASLDTFRGNESFLAGAAPPAGTLKIREDDTKVITIGNGAGRFDVPLNLAFPNGLVSFQLTAASSAGGQLAGVRAEIAFTTLASLSGVAYQAAGAYTPSGAGIRVNYTAVGW